MVGATGCGKSTTLAAMGNYRNEKTSSHIITIEDPIEFLHKNKKSIINQREIGSDTRSYARALKSAMREAPDVILIGEIRDRETMQAAIDLSGTGHLVIATLHSNNTPETLDRVINIFPEDQHAQVYMDMSQYLRAIISQRLVRGVGGERRVAAEIMLNTPRISELVRGGDVSKVKESFYDSTEQGMQTFDQSLLKLYQDGKVTMDEALANADSRANLEAQIHFG
jgi:twitching motility protein PilU